MAELKGVQTYEDRLKDGHQVRYKFSVRRLDADRRTFHPLEYNTGCDSISTSWRIELTYERIPEKNNTYTFTVKARRMDSSNLSVKASIFVTFHDARKNSLLVPLIIKRKNRMIPGDEVKDVLDSITRSDLSSVASIIVSINIEQCHMEDIYLLAPKVKTNNSINLSKL